MQVFFFVFPSYFGTSCSIARAYNDTILSPDNAFENVSRYFWLAFTRHNQNDDLPFYSRNEPVKSRFLGKLDIPL